MWPLAHGHRVNYTVLGLAPCVLIYSCTFVPSCESLQAVCIYTASPDTLTSESSRLCLMLLMGAIWGGGGALAPHPPDFLTYIHTTNEVNLVLCSEGVKGHNTSNIGEQYYSIAKLELMSCSLYLAPLLCNTCIAQSRYCRTLEITDSTTTESLQRKLLKHSYARVSASGIGWCRVVDNLDHRTRIKLLNPCE